MTEQDNLPVRENVYVVAFNTLDKSFSAEDIQRIVEGSKLVEAWWNYFPGVYLVQLGCDPHSFAKSLYDKLDNLSLFITKINEGQFSGRLPGDAWLWLLNIPEEDKVALKRLMDDKLNKGRSEADA